MRSVFKTYVPALLTLISLCLSTGCTHRPVYPEVGDAIIDSEPRGAEVLIDGAMTHQMTPCRINGIMSGAHRLTLCFYNYRIQDNDFVVKPGQTVRLFIPLRFTNVVKLQSRLLNSGVSMSVDQESGEICVATLSQVLIFKAQDSVITGPLQVATKGIKKALAMDARNGRVFYVCQDDGVPLLVFGDSNTGTILREYVQPDSSRYVKLALSADRNILLVADSLGRRLLVMDARTCAMVKGIPLSGCPSDVIFGRTPNEAYVTLCGSNRLARVDLEAGEEREWAQTGNNPRCPFWNNDQTQLGCCNSTDKQLTIVDLKTWASAIVVQLTSGTSIQAACWTDELYYLMLMRLDRGIWGEGGALEIAFARNWETARKIEMHEEGIPVDMAWMPTIKRYVVLNTNCLWLLRGEF